MFLFLHLLVVHRCITHHICLKRSCWNLLMTSRAPPRLEMDLLSSVYGRRTRRCGSVWLYPHVRHAHVLTGNKTVNRIAKNASTTNVLQSTRRKRRPSEKVLWWSIRRSCVHSPGPRQQRSKQRRNMHWSRWWRSEWMTHSHVYHSCDSAFNSDMATKCFLSRWKLESDERDAIKKLKDTERERMTAELAAWQQKQKKQVQVKSPEKNLSHAECSVVQQQNRGSGGEQVKSFSEWIRTVGLLELV